MKMRALTCWFALVVAGIACAAPPELEKRPDEKYVSLIQLIANPDAFDGRYVSVSGYLTLSDEYESSLFLDENSYSSGLSANSVAIDLESSKGEIQKRAKERDRKYVVVAGRFKAGPTAFSGGTLQGVYYLAPAPKAE